MVIVELRSVPHCPNLALVRETLYASLAGLGVAAEVLEVVGDYPSPSVLVNGVDVMGGAAGGSAACRLDLPTAEHIRAALHQGIADGSAGPPTVADAATTDCCMRAGDAIRIDRPRVAARLPDWLRHVHQAILHHFSVTATAPSPADLRSADAAAGVDPAAALRALADDDLIAVDRDGRLVAAYPFSPTPTAHRVSSGGVENYAMCAIDALGLPFMLRADAVITSADPHSGEPVQVTIVDRHATFQPPGTVVVYAATTATGRSVDTCCSTINFFICADSAQAWIAAHPSLAATVLNQAQAVTLGRDIFEPLLT